MKTVVVGAAGQLGRALVPLLKGEVVPLTRAELDLTNAVEVAAKLEAMRPNVVINTAAYNLVDKAESEPEAAFAVNAWAVRSLALACRSIDAQFVHFSTDYVFGLDRTRDRPWTELDAPGPVSAYGLSKLSGEYWTRQISERNLAIRTCGLYGLRGAGGKGGNFVETMLRVAREGKPLRVVADQRCTPSFVNHIASATIQLLDSGAKGLFHLTNSGDCSWHEFAAEIFRQAKLQPSLTAIPSVEYKTPAQRPAYSVLDCSKASAAASLKMPPWQEALADYYRIAKG